MAVLRNHYLVVQQRNRLSNLFLFLTVLGYVSTHWHHAFLLGCCPAFQLYLVMNDVSQNHPRNTSRIELFERDMLWDRRKFNDYGT